MDEMFDSCEGLTAMDLSHFDTSKVTSYYDMFYDCNRLTSVTLPIMNTSGESVNVMGLFDGCSSLATVNLVIPSGKTIPVSGSNMFDGCSSLTVLDLRNLKFSGWISFMFAKCSKLTTIYTSCPWEVTIREGYDDAPGQYYDPFYQCYSLKGKVAYTSTKGTATMANYSNGYFTYKAAK